MSITQPVLGLRDRKRIETRARIEAAAVFLVLRDGLDATTVDAISERADISPRTFFNYYDSKDSAILGVPHAGPDEEVVPVHPGEDLVPCVVRLVANAMGVTAQSRATLHDDRREVVRRHPEVLGGQMAQLSARADRLTASITELMDADPAFAGDDDRAPYAELLLGVCGTAVRVAVREWAADGSREPVEAVEGRAITLVTATVGKLA